MVIPNLDQVEADVQRLTLDHHRSELAVVESMLNAYLACFREIDSLTRTADNESEQVWLLLTNRSFNVKGGVKVYQWGGAKLYH